MQQEPEEVSPVMVDEEVVDSLAVVVEKFLVDRRAVDGLDEFPHCVARPCDGDLHAVVDRFAANAHVRQPGWGKKVHSPWTDSGMIDVRLESRFKITHHQSYLLDLGNKAIGQHDHFPFLRRVVKTLLPIAVPSWFNGIGSYGKMKPIAFIC